MIRNRLAKGLVLVLLAGSQNALAQDAATAPLDCMATSYTPEQREQLDTLLLQFDLLNEDDSDVSDKVIGIAISAVETCDRRLDWTEGQKDFAYIYEVTRLSDAAFRLSGALAKNEITRIDTALAKGDRSNLARILADGFLDQSSNEIDDDDALVLGLFAEEVGLNNNDEKTETLGVILSFWALQHVAGSRFDSAQ